MQFRVFDKPLSKIPEMGTKKSDYETGLQNGNPSFGCCMRYAAVGCQTRKIQNLAVPTGAKPDETAESFKVADIQDTADIAFKISLVIISQPVARRKFFVMYARVES